MIDNMFKRKTIFIERNIYGQKNLSDV